VPVSGGPPFSRGLWARGDAGDAGCLRGFAANRPHRPAAPRKRSIDVLKMRQKGVYLTHWPITQGKLMSARFNVMLSDDLNKLIDQAATKNETNKSEVIRKALQLYLAAQDGKEKGLGIGLIDPETDQVTTRFVGL
jgi:predicted transcriptional regulator